MRKFKKKEKSCNRFYNLSLQKTSNMTINSSKNIEKMLAKEIVQLSNMSIYNLHVGPSLRKK